MKKNLLRGLALAGALSFTSLAAANPWDIGKCYIRCTNGATAGPYWSTDISCCADFQTLCGGVGEAYTQFDTYPEPSRSYCPD